MRVFLYAFRNMYRNPFLSFSTLLVLMLVTFFASILILVEHTTDSLINRVTERISLSVYLQKGVTEESAQLQVFKRDLANIDPSLHIEYQSSQQALDDLRKRIPDITGIVEGSDDDILPAKIFVQIKPDVSRRFRSEIYDEINTIVEKNKEILLYGENTPTYASLVDYRAQYEQVAKMVAIFQSISYGALAILVLAIFSATAIIYSSIGNMVFYSREEVNIIGLVGGSRTYLYMPFVIQSICYICIALVLSSILFWLCLQALSISILEGYKQFTYQFYQVRGTEIAIVFFVFLSVGAIGSYISVRHALGMIRAGSR